MLVVILLYCMHLSKGASRAYYKTVSKGQAKHLRKLYWSLFHESTLSKLISKQVNKQDPRNKEEESRDTTGRRNLKWGILLE